MSSPQVVIMIYVRSEGARSSHGRIMGFRGYGVLVLAVALAGIACSPSRSDDPAESDDEGPKRAPTWSVRLDGLRPVREAMVAADFVLVKGENKLSVLDKRDGRLRWEKPLGQQRDVRVGDGGVAVYSRDSARIYNLVTGIERDPTLRRMSAMPRTASPRTLRRLH